MGAVVQFNYANWIALYPEFNVPAAQVAVTPAQAQNYFTLATAIQANDGSGPTDDAALATTLLYLLTAHFAYVMGTAASGGSGSTLVGQMTNASEGSVSVGVAALAIGGIKSMLLGSKYGAEWLLLTAPWRRMHYRPGYGRNYSPAGGPLGYGGGFLWPR